VRTNVRRASISVMCDLRSVEEIRRTVVDVRRAWSKDAHAALTNSAGLAHALRMVERMTAGI